MAARLSRRLDLTNYPRSLAEGHDGLGTLVRDKLPPSNVAACSELAETADAVSFAGSTCTIEIPEVLAAKFVLPLYFAVKL
jgi:hypothetical protein